MRRERTNLFSCRKTQFCDTRRTALKAVLLYCLNDLLQEHIHHTFALGVIDGIEIRNILHAEEFIVSFCVGSHLGIA